MTRPKATGGDARRFLDAHDDGGGAALYAGGEFTTAGGVSATRIARWDGASWSALGSGMAGGVSTAVHAFAVFDDDGGGDGPALYASGSFTTAGGVNANNIARWNGASWSALGSGVNDTINALAIFDDGGGPALYAGGFFTTAGGVSTSRIARWDGASWSALGSGVNNTVRALAVFDDGGDGGPALYAGGAFTTAGGVSANRIARWDGASWSALGSGVSGVVYVLAVFDDGGGGGPALYAGGTFTTAGGVSANLIARWDGASWSALGSGVDSDVRALAVFDDGGGGGPALYAGGFFTTAGGVGASFIARWDGASWSTLGSGISNGGVDALVVFDDGGGGGPALYAGGNFSSAGSVNANRIARWDGSSWSALGSGVDWDVNALAVFDDGSGGGPALYVGGAFITAGGVNANFIARWNGTAWSALGSGVGGPSFPEVNALAVFDDGGGGGPALYAGGNFTTAGGVSANRLARWDGASWSALGSGVNDAVNALAVFDDGGGGGPSLYGGGFFTTAGGMNANRIARWDGTSWSTLGSGVNAAVNALAVLDDAGGGGPALYAGGGFTTAGGVSASRIARWDNASWSALGSGVGGAGSPAVTALAVFDDGGGSGPALYAGGNFTTAGGVSANRIARWDRISWSALGSGVNDAVRALAVFDDGGGDVPALYAGGIFTTAGGVGAGRIAQWGCQPASDSRTASALAGLPPRGARKAEPTGVGSRRRHLQLGPGDTLSIGNLVVAYDSIRAAAGSTIELHHPGAVLRVTNLIVESGAILDWQAGTIEIDRGTWSHPDEILIGCVGPAALLMIDGASMHAPAVHVCTLGELVGEGTIQALVSSTGVVAPLDSGLAIQGEYTQAAGGMLAASSTSTGPAMAPLTTSAMAILSGTLAMELRPGADAAQWAHECNEPIGILTAGSIIGAFDQVEAVGLSCGMALVPMYMPGHVAIAPTAGSPSADLNCDGVVTAIDLALLLAAWGTCNNECCLADIAPTEARDGVVDAADLTTLLAAMETTP